MMPLLIDPDGQRTKAYLKPDVLIDAIIAKKNLGTKTDDARLVIGLGPGFTCGKDVHIVVETNRGHDLGRVIWQGSAEADTGLPDRVAGYQGERVLRAPAGIRGNYGHLLPGTGDASRFFGHHRAKRLAGCQQNSGFLGGAGEKEHPRYGKGK